ncbi:hypothetical protein GCM10009661_27020 [Catellatospora chokoriensis]|uniref:Uncharacterized protein n=1 Tax=Catellatospora chokoriensis TaxID=310353 RepID=A0A8J3JMC9_9ACTN|nr:hypothetical protein Cch02nite_10950 [Catellatospora chokoriensis]
MAGIRMPVTETGDAGGDSPAPRPRLVLPRIIRLDSHKGDLRVVAGQPSPVGEADSHPARRRDGPTHKASRE